MGSLINKTFLDELAERNSDKLTRNKLQAEMHKKTAKIEHNRKLVFTYLQEHFPLVEIDYYEIDKLSPKEFQRILRLAKRRKILNNTLYAIKKSLVFVPLIVCILLVISSFFIHSGWSFISIVSGLIGIILSTHLIEGDLGEIMVHLFS